MGQDVELSCRCGQITGWLRDVSPSGVHRAVCYCDDCQAFVHFLGRAELLDEHGGTDVVQVPPNKMTLDRGLDQIAGVRLTTKGLYRWYANCCKTPLGNMVSPSVPFIGLPLEALRGAPDVHRVDELFGKSRASVMTRFAIGDVRDGSRGFAVGHLVHVLGKVFGWKLTGKTWPHPFFEKGAREPKYPVKVLQAAERDALRAKP